MTAAVLAAERLLLDLPPDHPFAQAARVILAERDEALRHVARLERLIAEGLRGRAVAGRKLTGTGA